MTKDRKSATALAAREKARTKAQEMTQRHELLLEKAADFFVLEEQSTALMEQARAQAQQILAQATRTAGAERSARGRIVLEMLAIGESRALVAQRLGVSAGELRALVDAAGTTAHGSAAGLPGSG